MSWFDVVEAPDGRSYSVSAYRTGTVRVGAVPGAMPAIASVGRLFPLAAIGWVANLLFFSDSWTVRVAPWYGRRGKRWKFRVKGEPESDRRAEALCQLIKTGQWDPRREAPPRPATPAEIAAAREGSAGPPVD